jgi:uncharacterized SAM-binding protein YcdF (DUF218 family)
VELFLSKLVAQLVYPIGVSIWLALLAVVLIWLGWRLGATVVLLLSIGCLWVCSTGVFSDYIRGSLESRYEPVRVEASPSADAIVVLGGGLGGIVSPRLTVDLNSTADRVLHGARLFKAGKAPVVIVSGGNIEWLSASGPGSQAMASLLEEWGVPERAIILESKSRNTYENALYTKQVIDDRGFEKILLVTSALHMPRSVAIFRSFGIDVIPSPTDIEVVDRGDRTVLDWLPNADSLAGTTRAIKEYLGFVYYWWRGFI